MSDDADNAQLVEERERDSVVAAMRRRVLQLPTEIREDCLDCDGPIGARRLAANPTARRCLVCQQQLETVDRFFSKG